jgi:hypothetical protein
MVEPSSAHYTEQRAENASRWTVAGGFGRAKGDQADAVEIAELYAKLSICEQTIREPSSVG